MIHKDELHINQVRNSDNVKDNTIIMVMFKLLPGLLHIIIFCIRLANIYFEDHTTIFNISRLSDFKNSAFLQMICILFNDKLRFVSKR